MRKAWVLLGAILCASDPSYGGTFPEANVRQFRIEEDSQRLEIPAGKDVVVGEIHAPKGSEQIGLKFQSAALGDSEVTIRGADDDLVFDADSFSDYEGSTGLFNGDKLEIELRRDPNDRKKGHAITLDRMFVVESLEDKKVLESPPSAPESVPSMEQETLLAKSPAEPSSSVLAWFSDAESLCRNPEDSRVALKHPFIGRVYGTDRSAACTAFLLPGGLLATAGHCDPQALRFVEFKVPQSSETGDPRRSKKADEYKIQSEFPAYRGGNTTNAGDDFALFRVLKNANTGKLPHEAYGGSFVVGEPTEGMAIRVAGYGFDTTPRGKQGSAYNSANRTLQQDEGTIRKIAKKGDVIRHYYTKGPKRGLVQTVESAGVALLHDADTNNGNSGSPIIAVGKTGPNGEEVVVGIHSYGGCVEGQPDYNKGISLTDETVVAMIKAHLASN